MKLPTYGYQESPFTPLGVPREPRLPEGYGREMAGAVVKVGGELQDLAVAQAQVENRLVQSREAVRTASHLMQMRERSAHATAYPNLNLTPEENAQAFEQQEMQLMQEHVKTIRGEPNQNLVQAHILQQIGIHSGEVRHAARLKWNEQSTAEFNAFRSQSIQRFAAAPTEEEQQTIVREFQGLSQSRVATGQMTAVEAEKERQQYLEQGAEALFLNRFRSDPAGTTKALEGGKGFYGAIPPKRHEEMIDKAWGRYDRMRKQADAESEKHTKAVNEETEAEIFGLLWGKADPDSVEVKAQGLFLAGKLSRSGLENIRREITAQSPEATKDNESLYVDLKTRVQRHGGEIPSIQEILGPSTGENPQLTRKTAEGLLRERNARINDEEAAARRDAKEGEVPRYEITRLAGEVRFSIRNEARKSNVDADRLSRWELNATQAFNARVQAGENPYDVAREESSKGIAILHAENVKTISEQIDHRWTSLQELDQVRSRKDPSLPDYMYQQQRDLWLALQKVTKAQAIRDYQKALEKYEMERNRWFKFRAGPEEPLTPPTPPEGYEPAGVSRGKGVRGAAPRR